MEDVEGRVALQTFKHVSCTALNLGPGTHKHATVREVCQSGQTNIWIPDSLNVKVFLKVPEENKGRE